MGVDVTVVTTALDEVLELGSGRLASEDLAEVRALRERIDRRLAHGDGLTVVALAGGTGVGKSALLNRLVEASVATEGVRRPTTDRPVAVTEELTGPATALLTWLGVDDRRELVPDPGDDGPTNLSDGLVLVDLPDHDSVVVEHERTAARLADRVDALVIVVDPLKYAREDLHRGQLARLREHAAVVTVALNRADELSRDGLRRCLEDLRGRLEEVGLGDVEVFVTSAATGEGIDDLRAHLSALAGERASARRRVIADAAQVAERLLAGVPDPSRREPDPAPLIEPLLEASDGHRAVLEAEQRYRRDAREATRSPPARWVRSPLRLAGRLVEDLGLRRGGSGVSAGDPVRIERALARELRLHDTVGADHRMLGSTLEETAGAAAPALADAVGYATGGTPQRTWWTPVSWARGLSEAALLVGLMWSVLLGVADWLALPEMPTPEATEGLTWPAALLLYGLGARILLGLATRAVVGLGARRHRERTDATLRAEVIETIRAYVLAPYQREVTAYARLRDALERLRRSSGGD